VLNVGEWIAAPFLGALCDVFEVDDEVEDGIEVVRGAEIVKGDVEVEGNGSVSSGRWRNALMR
jgi:hypothetical protein